MNRNELNSAATADAITESFFRHLSASGLEQFSIGDICEDCHISRTTFYRYFSDKYDVLEKKEQYLLSGTAGFSAGKSLFVSGDNGSPAPAPTLVALLEFVQQNMLYYRTILASDFSRRFMVKWSAQIHQGFRSRFGMDDLQYRELQLRILSGGFLAGLSYWIEKEPELPASKAAEIFADIISQEKSRYFIF